MSKIILKTENLSKSFGKLEVLKSISTEIYQAEVVAILGASGSGKSTFLRCINLLERPSTGKVYFHDREITHPKANIAKIRQRLVMVFQHFNLFSPYDNIRKYYLCTNQSEESRKTSSKT